MRRLCVLVIVLVWLTPAAAAQEPAAVGDVGWWTRQPGAQPKPDGATEIARTPEGAVSVAGLRVDVSGRIQKATLVLSESGGVGQESAGARVCVTSSTWSSANPGAWSEAPVPDCEGGSADLTRNAVQSSWSAEVGTLLSAPQTALVVQPLSGGDLPVSGFRIEFSKAQIVAEAAPATPAPSGGAGSTGTPPAAAPDRFTPPGFGAFTPAAAPAPSTGTLPAIAEPEMTAPLHEGRTVPSRVDTVPPAERDDRPWGRLVVLVPLAALVGTAVAYGRRLYRVRIAG